MKKLLLIGGLVGSLFGFNNIVNNVNSNYNYVVEGKVVKAYTQNGYGRRQTQWLFIDVKTKNGIKQVAIAPTFRISNLPINEGDEVKVNGITPLRFPAGVIKAWDIYDITQKKDYPISGGYYGPRRGW